MRVKGFFIQVKLVIRICIFVIKYKNTMIVLNRKKPKEKINQKICRR